MKCNKVYLFQVPFNYDQSFDLLPCLAWSVLFHDGLQYIPCMSIRFSNLWYRVKNEGIFLKMKFTKNVLVQWIWNQTSDMERSGRFESMGWNFLLVLSSLIVDFQCYFISVLVFEFMSFLLKASSLFLSHQFSSVHHPSSDLSDHGHQPSNHQMASIT